MKKARPSKLYLISDGPRNDKEKERILESRAIVEDIIVAFRIKAITTTNA